jgi:class 3 adenylate cyclase
MSPPRGSRVLVTVLFTDIVGSTEIAAELGDRRWRDLVQRHHAVVRRELKRAGGRELDTAGDGFFASFDRPAQAIRCACAISDEVRELGVEVRAGLHLGEAEVLEGKVGGIAVNVGARVMGVGKAGEVLVSSTLRDAVAGSGFDFADHGAHRLKGIEGEWRLYEVKAVENVRRALPLSAEESRTRREFTRAVPVHRRRDRVIAGVAGGLVVAVIAAGILTNALGADPPGPSGGEPGLSEDERSLVAVVPPDLRGTCGPATSSLRDAIASIDCGREPYAVTYSRFDAIEEMQDRFDAFAVGVPSLGDDCSTDPSAVSEYTVNSIARGQVACYVDERASGLNTATSVIVWTDEELLVLGRALRDDAADLTLYEWWRTEAGPSKSSAQPPKDGPAELLEGSFELTIVKDDVGPAQEGGADRSWIGSWMLRLSAEDGFVGMPTHEHGGELLYGKPHLVIFNYGSSFAGFGAQCPAFQSVSWRERARRVSFEHPVGDCRERNLEILMFAPWSRTS